MWLHTLLQNCYSTYILHTVYKYILAGPKLENDGIDVVLDWNRKGDLRHQINEFTAEKT